MIKLFRVILDSNDSVQPGDILSVTPQPDRIRWFDPSNELAVA